MSYSAARTSEVPKFDVVDAVTPVGTGARIDWAWTLYPNAAPARLTLNVIGQMWKGYAERALGELETILTRG